MNGSIKRAPRIARSLAECASRMALSQSNKRQSMKGETLGENSNDASITTAVKTKLAEDRPATLTQVSVETSLRPVHLTGAVKGEFLRQRGAELAKGVKGVREVANDITVQANPQGARALGVQGR
jgi:hyperosmotically inducible protein